MARGNKYFLSQQLVTAHASAPPSCCGPLPPIVSPTGASLPSTLAKKCRDDERKVRFNEKVRAKFTIHLDDFAEDEVERYWYSAKELKMIRKQLKKEASLAGSTSLSKDEDFEGRGLANFTSEGSKKRYENQKLSIALVLNEQEFQNEEGIDDPEYIAEIYAGVAAPCINTAKVKAAR